MCVLARNFDCDSSPGLKTLPLWKTHRSGCGCPRQKMTPPPPPPWPDELCFGEGGGHVDMIFPPMWKWMVVIDQERELL